MDPEAVRRAVTPRTRLIVLTNLHNPSSVLTGDEVLREVGEIAREAGARVLVDEVYLDAVYENTPRTSFHLGPQFVVTSSLTKVYGVSGLRCGWILAEADLARAMRRLNDCMAATPVHPGELLSVAVFGQLGSIRERFRRIVEADRKVLNAFLNRAGKVDAVRTPWGTTSFLRVAGGDADGFLAQTEERVGDFGRPGPLLRSAGLFARRHGCELGDVRRGPFPAGACAVKDAHCRAALLTSGSPGSCRCARERGRAIRGRWCPLRLP